MLGRSSGNHDWLLAKALALLAVFVYATHATQAIAFEWKPGLTLTACPTITPVTCCHPDTNTLRQKFKNHLR